MTVTEIRTFNARRGRLRPGRVDALSRLLPRCPDPDMALNNLERFFANPAAPPLLPTLLDNRARALEILLGLFSTSQLFSDLLAQYPDYLDMLRVPLRRSPSFAELRDGLLAGYQRVRPLPAGLDAHLPAFLALRELKLMMWFLERRGEPGFELGPNELRKSVQYLRDLIRQIDLGA